MSVRNAILGLLAQHPRHGYELHAALEALVGGQQVWDIKPAQIYTTLTRLEGSGLVAQDSIEKDGGPAKRIYMLTPAGDRELSDWFASPVPNKTQHDEFYLKLVICLATRQTDPHQVLHVQRAHLYKELHDLTARRGMANPKQELAQILLCDQAVMHIEADLRWLDMVETRIEDVQRQPLPVPEIRLRGRPPKARLDLD